MEQLILFPVNRKCYTLFDRMLHCLDTLDGDRSYERRFEAFREACRVVAKWESEGDPKVGFYKPLLRNVYARGFTINPLYVRDSINPKCFFFPDISDNAVQPSLVF